ncbi:MAG: hypothetical protein PWP76_82 [Candidatus Diapherotrites archaeon]|nr:hypothetical protein [Candidatus Diapherotrites archaeon]MDN5367236.1 hypothetical protein [Candidatus Diapherotrites archaeon]
MHVGFSLFPFHPHDCKETIGTGNELAMNKVIKAKDTHRTSKEMTFYNH